jgi:hypothetical protein
MIMPMRRMKTARRTSTREKALAETAKRRRGDGETRGQGDKETRRERDDDAEARGTAVIGNW